MLKDSFCLYIRLVGPRMHQEVVVCFLFSAFTD